MMDPESKNVLVEIVALKEEREGYLKEAKRLKKDIQSLYLSLEKRAIQTKLDLDPKETGKGRKSSVETPQ